MFVTNSYNGYNRDGEQSAGGWYLIIASGKSGGTIPNPRPNSTPTLERLYAAVRYVRMTQCGQFMMGRARVGDTRLVLSGPYGNDGLPEDYDNLTERARKEFVALTDEETIAFWYPEHAGHNSTGSEAPAMRLIGKRLLSERRAKMRRR